MSTKTASSFHITVDLTAAVTSIIDQEPVILTVQYSHFAGLPSGPFDPLAHRTLYTFGDRGRHAHAGDKEPHTMSIGYLALAKSAMDMPDNTLQETQWLSWYKAFPWEDWRSGRPKVLDACILPSLKSWTTEHSASLKTRSERTDRVQLAFGLGAVPWNDEKVLERYELLYESGLIEEASRDGRESALKRDTALPLGFAMQFDHRRILATAIARLRGKLKYRPVVFELMPDSFTLTELQHSVEAITGRHLHKQNFRRLVETTAMVEQSGQYRTIGKGRPAALYRFRPEVVQERVSPGLRLGLTAPRRGH
jgi:hypothetical protein